MGVFNILLISFFRGYELERFIGYVKMFNLYILLKIWSRELGERINCIQVFLGALFVKRGNRLNVYFLMGG